MEKRVFYFFTNRTISRLIGGNYKQIDWARKVRQDSRSLIGTTMLTADISLPFAAGAFPLPPRRARPALQFA